MASVGAVGWTAPTFRAVIRGRVVVCDYLGRSRGRRALSLDDLVGLSQKQWRHGKAERIGCL